MYHTILIPIAPDHIEALPESLAVADALAAEGAGIQVLSVVDVVPTYIVAEIGGQVYERSTAEARERLSKALSDRPGLEVAVALGTPPATIVEAARTGGCDLVIVRSHKPGLKDWVLGSTAARVVRSAPCAVHVIR